MAAPHVFDVLAGHGQHEVGGAEIGARELPAAPARALTPTMASRVRQLIGMPDHAGPAVR
jgi:hypothetical protein